MVHIRSAGARTVLISFTAVLVNSDILHDYKVELTGVRNRSQINADNNIVI